MSKGIDTGLVDRVIAATRAIRDLVNIGRRHRRIMRDSPSYNTISSAMDTLADTAEAVGAYGKRDVSRDETYLLSYGVLQALYVQQDAAFWLCKLLDILPMSSFGGPGDWARSIPAIAAARTARNSSVGHPVRRDKGGPLASFFLVQSTLRVGGFQLVEAAGRGRRFVSVDVSKLGEEQLVAISSLLKDAARQLRDADQAHRQVFMNEKLRLILDKLNYPIQNLGAVTETNSRVDMPGFVNAIKNGMDLFRRSLRERGEPFEAGFQYSYRKLSRALRVLDDHVAEVEYADADLAEVAATLVYHEVEHLKRCAQEIDNDYAEGSKDDVTAKPDPSPIPLEGQKSVP